MFAAVELAELGTKAAGTDVGLASDAELLAAVGELARARAGLAAAEAHVLAELDARGVCDREFGLATGSWAAAQTRGPRAGCRARVRVATGLRALAVVDEALAGGRIGTDHVAVLVEAVANPRVADQIIDLQPELVAAAERTPFEIWRADVGALVELLDQDGGFDPDRDQARNRLHLCHLGPDHVLVRGELVGEPALVVSNALNTTADRLWRRHHHDHQHDPDLPVPRRATLLALAAEELCRAGLAAEPTASSGPVADVTLVLHATERHAAGRDEPTEITGVLATLDGGILTRPERYAHLRCDPALTAVTVNQVGVPLNLGGTVRYATPAQRRALAVRDGGCTFPGCDAPVSWCDAHHVHPYQHGGATDIHNLALLCRHHHGVTHRRGWTMTPDIDGPDQTFSWTTPSGRVLASQHHLGRPPPDP